MKSQSLSDSKGEYFMYLGVDFGTSYSQVAYRHNGVVKVLEKSGQYGIDSVFYYDSISAEERMNEYINSFKKEISKKAINDGTPKTEEEILKEVDSIMTKLEKYHFGTVGNTAYRYVGYEDSFNNLVREVKVKIGEEFELDGETFTAEEIIKAIYHEVIFNFAKKRGEEYLPDFTVDGVVLSHPVQFTMHEVNTLCSAAKNCLGDGTSVNVIATIKEPVAAAIAYYEARPDLPDGTGILVYDLGGGTCDVALVCKKAESDQEFEVIDAGMLRVGGRDWDDIVYDYIANEIKSKKPDNDFIFNNADNVFSFVKLAREMKEELTESNSSKRMVDFWTEEGIRDTLKIEITRAMFDDLSQTLRNQTVNMLEKMYLSHVDNVNIEEIILVGGSSYMPQIKEGIEERFEHKNITVRLHNPVHATCQGAAIYADKLMQKLKENYTDDEIQEKYDQINNSDETTGNMAALLLFDEGENNNVITDIIPFSYGIKYHYSGNTYIKNLVKRGEVFPATGVCRDFNPKNDATSVKIEIYESENSESSYCYNGERLVGHVILDVPEGITRSDKIECVINILSLDTVKVSANGKGKNASAEFKLN